MGTIKDPVLFSEHFSVDEMLLEEKGVLNPVLNIDSPLFIDPLLLARSKAKEMQAADVAYKDFYAGIYRLLVASKSKGDRCWRQAFKLFDFPEVKENCLGYGSDNIDGHGWGPLLRKRALEASKEIIDLGVDDPFLFTALPIFESEIGKDRISDMLTNIVCEELSAHTRRILNELELDVPMIKIRIHGKTCLLPSNPLAGNHGFMLLPLDVLRDIPIPAAWSEIWSNAAENEELREKVSEQIGAVWEFETSEAKAEARQKMKESKDAASTVLEAFLDSSKKLSSYDVVRDHEGILSWIKAHSSIATDFPLKLVQPEKKDRASLVTLVLTIIEHFQYLVENQGLWKLLWDGDKRKPEKAAQLLFFGISDAYCKANVIDISPEADSGNGPVDFKFSTGYDHRVLVEVKMSENTQLVRGYEKQLEAYMQSEHTDMSYYLILDVGKLGNKLERIIDLKNSFQVEKKVKPEFVVVDALKRSSASKR